MRNLREEPGSVCVWLKPVKSEKRDVDSRAQQNTREVWNGSLSRWQWHHAWCEYTCTCSKLSHLHSGSILSDNLCGCVLAPYCKEVHCILKNTAFALIGIWVLHPYVELESCLCSWIQDLVCVETMCVSWRYLLNGYFLTGWEMCGWTDGRRHSEPTQSTCSVVLEHVRVFVDNVPCAATPPFPIFKELCLSLQPWQQKMTNGRTVEMLRLGVRLNDRASFLDRKSNHSVSE